MPETILIVDDEEPVRKTFREWLDGADLDCHILVAADAESALLHANRNTIDLAILDWNLGAGNDGLQLLEDLCLFNADIVAIMITGFAHQATPLDAMRMGVRDYLDKNQDLNRAAFLGAVRRQLERIRPAKRERRLHTGLVAFRESVEKVLPLVRSAAALNDPLPLPEAIRGLFRFLLRSTGASDGALLVRGFDPKETPAEVCRAYAADGQAIDAPLLPFARSLAGSVATADEPCAMRLDTATSGGIELQPFEQGRRTLLAASMAVAPGTHVVLELFDKRDGEFTGDDRRLVAAAADLGAEMLRQALAQRQTQGLLHDAVAAALMASDALAETLHGTPRERQEEPPPAAVLDRLREGLSAAAVADSLPLLEAVRVLALRHGAPAIDHCTRLIESLRTLLDTLTGTPDEGR